MNWNQRPRDEVERAAIAGDRDAIACLKVHQTFDRMDAQMQAMHESLVRLRQTIRECRLTKGDTQ
jgi:hypothetical protein